MDQNLNTTLSPPHMSTDLELDLMEDVIWLIKAQIPFMAIVVILSVLLAEQLEVGKDRKDGKKEEGLVLATKKIEAKWMARAITATNDSSGSSNNNFLHIFSLIGKLITTVLHFGSASSKGRKGLLETIFGFYFGRFIVPLQLLPTCSHKREHYNCHSLQQETSSNESSFFVSEEVESSSNSTYSLEGEDTNANNDHDALDQHSVDTLRLVRQGFQSIDKQHFEAGCRTWDKLLRKSKNAATKGEGLVSGTTYVPRRDHILHEWNIADKAPSPSSSTLPHLDHDWSRCDYGKNRPLEVQLLCPSSLLSNDENVTLEETNKSHKTFHPRNLNELNMTQLRENVPIVIYFHGGGFFSGSSNDWFTSLLAHTIMQQNLNKTSAPQAIVLLSVGYRLAPECPFPGGLIDCLSATQHILDIFPHNPIHLAGLSAGGNLAGVVGFECVRKYPKRIMSLAMIQPVCNPRCDALTLLDNGQSSIISPDVVHWGWQAYLQIDRTSKSKSNENESYIESLMQHPLFRLGKIGTINPLLRLVWPQVDIPLKELKAQSQSGLFPKIIVSTATADPFHDEGMTLLESLRDGGLSPEAVLGQEMKGDHATALLLDKKWKKEFMTEWSACLWPNVEMEGCN